MSKKQRQSRGYVPVSKKAKKQYELLGGVSVLTASALIVSVFLLTSLDKILIQTNQYASVIASVLVDLANNDRSANELDGLTVSPVLVAAAQAKADDMAAKGYFAHTSPDGKDPWYWFKKVGYQYEYAGENLAVDFTDSGDVNTAWMNSPLHRENLLNGHYTEVGIAMATGMFQGHPTTFVVQMFGTPVKKAETVEVASNVPEDSMSPAVAKAAPQEKPQVLGESASASEESVRVLAQPSTKPSAHEAAAPRDVVEKMPRQSSWWDGLLAKPRTTSQVAYYLLALCVLLALAIDTGFELRWHHQRKAARAAFLLILILTFFIAGNYYVFTTPAVPATGVAAAASSLR